MAIKDHEVITTEMLITSARGKTAKFLDDKIPEALYQDGFFRSGKFVSFKDGEHVQATFRISTSARHLVSVKPTSAAPAAPKPQPVTQPIPQLTPKEDTGVWAGKIYFDGPLATAFGIADDIAAKWGNVNVRMTGKSGYGKTAVPRAFAEETGRKFLRMNAAIVRDPEEWFGYREAEDGSTRFVPTTFTEAVMEGDYVILIDEANRMEPWIANSLFPLLDDDRETEVHNYTIRSGGNIVFILSVNEGAEYVGTFEMDQALKNRIAIHIEVGPLPIPVEIELLQLRYDIAKDDAQKIVSALDKFRKDSKFEEIDVDVTTRTSLNIAQIVSCGATIRWAAQMTIVNSLRSEARKGILDVVNTVLGTLK